MLSAAKPILINGSPRSGTTYLYHYLVWKYGKALFEPVTSLMGVCQLPNELKMKALKIALPCEVKRTGSFMEFHIFWNREELRQYMELLRGFSLKDITLHLFLDEEFINENWDVYHIIRNPVTTYLSLKEFMLKTRVGWNVFGWAVESCERKSPLCKIGAPLSKLYVTLIGMRETPQKLITTLKCKNILSFKDPFEAFVVYWVLANYIAVKSIPNAKLLVYERPETFSKLPDYDEYARERPFKPKRRSDSTLEKRVDEIVKEYELLEEYEYLKSRMEEA